MRFGAGATCRRSWILWRQYLAPLAVPELDVENEFVAAARRVYCGTIGAEFMHITSRERREWLAERLEGEAPAVDQQRILRQLARADIFEQVIQSRYLGTKRFSLEGVTALIPFLDETLNRAAELGAQRVDDGHEPSRTPERDGEHAGQIAGGYLREI